MEEIPIELDCFLIKHGFFKASEMPDFEPYRFKHRTKQVVFVSTTPARRTNKGHVEVFIPTPKEEYIAWKPSYEGEEPPF